MGRFNFKISYKDNKSKARVGQITTPHGVIETPNFVPVGTRATVRSLSPQDLKETGAQIIFGNTYHLHLRPGEDVVSEFGGISKFMSWNGPTITDSGGFQVFSLIHRENFGRLSQPPDDAHSSHSKIKSNTRSLSENQLQNNSLLEGKNKLIFSSSVGGQAPSAESPTLVKITDDGVTFRSHIDGSLHIFTPEKSIEIQQKLGADIILVFDECAPYPFTHESTKKAMERTHNWTRRCLEAISPRRSHGFASSACHLRGGEATTSTPRMVNYKQALYGIVQGGVYQDLREESAKFIGSQDFEGIAIGGVSVGESKKEMKEAVDWSVPFLPEEKPRHLLGVGEIDDLFAGVERGMDTFDCVIPTRFGRYGIAFVHPSESEEKGKYRINLPKAIYAKDKGPISKNCKCSTCQNYTRGYINHLFRSDELLGYRLVSYHNIYFIINLMKEIRKSILEDRFQELKREWVS